MSTAPDRTGTLVTGEELFEMGDIGPCELIDGRIVPKSPTRPRHGQIQVLLGGVLILSEAKGGARPRPSAFTGL